MNGLFEYVGGPKCGAKAAIGKPFRSGHVWMEVYDDIRPEDFEGFPEGGAIVFRYRVDGDKLILFSETVETDFPG